MTQLSDTPKKALTRRYWQEALRKQLWFCEAWRKDFEAFYGSVGARPGNARLRRIDASRPFEPGNVVWTARSGKPSLLSDAEVRDVLDLVHTHGAAHDAVLRLYPALTPRSLNDLLAGRRNVLPDYDYSIRYRKLAPDQRVPARLVRDISTLHSAGFNAQAIAARCGLPPERVEKVTARLHHKTSSPVNPAATRQPYDGALAPSQAAPDRLTDTTVREILSLGHHPQHAASPEAIAAIYPEVTPATVRELLSGRQHRLPDYNYPGLNIRVTRAAAEAARTAYHQGVPVESIAQRLNLPLPRVFAILARV